ncbi:MAG TPA: YsnF/AvaK domain-containing protein [Ktedonobacteraceae bacterium]|nr:YsnF/AvaK domain-containing protein [Ktedonobacteraceae bacterium]
MPEQDALNYQREYEAGRSIVAVTGNSRMDEARTIFASNGAFGANRQTAQATNNTTRAAGSVQGTPVTTENEQTIQLREEQLQVYKRPVQVGEVRLGKNVVSEQQAPNVPVTHEEVVINRQPVSGQVSETPIGEDESIRVPVSAERVNVTKQTVAKEEVEIGKRQIQENQQVTETVLYAYQRLLLMDEK